MQASFTTHSDGSVVLALDAEAACATFASVIFAARFHDEMKRLEPMALRGLEEERAIVNGGEQPCR